MRFTVNKLHKALGKLIEQGHARKYVSIAKETFHSNLEEDGLTILDVSGLGIQRIPIIDGDGGTAENIDGTEKSMACCVLVGSCGANHRGEIVSLTNRYNSP